MCVGGRRGKEQGQKCEECDIPEREKTKKNITKGKKEEK